MQAPPTAAAGKMEESFGSLISRPFQQSPTMPNNTASGPAWIAYSTTKSQVMTSNNKRSHLPVPQPKPKCNMRMQFLMMVNDTE